MSNKSHKYIFPSIFSRLHEEGMSAEVVAYIKKAYITDGSNNFVMLLTKKNKFLKTDMPEDVYLTIKDCKSVLSIEEKDDTFLIRVLFPDDLVQLKMLFLEGKYSEFSEDNKTDILDYHFNYSELNDYIRIGYVLYKNELLKTAMAKELQINVEDFPSDMELDSRVDVEKESYSEVEI